MPDVVMVVVDGLAFWTCEACGTEHQESRTFIGQVKCAGCKHLNFVAEVRR